MPQLDDITIKKFDGTTDVVWKGVIASSGDKNPAIWRNETVGSASGHMPTYKLESASSGNGLVRRLVGNGFYPETATATDGRVSVVNKLGLKVEWTVPTGMSQALVNEGAYQLANLIASSLIKSCTAAGYSAT